MRSKPFSEEEAERQRIRRANMTPEQVAAQRERGKVYNRTKRVRPEGWKYNRQHRRRVLEKNNHKAYSIRIGKVDYNELYKQFFEAQKGCCAICGNPSPEDKRLHLDHDHETGVVRGLLCYHCNSGLGFVEKHFEAILDYLEWSE